MKRRLDVFNTYIFIIVLAITGCAYGNYISNDYSKISEYDCKEKPQKVHLFFEGERIDFDYIKLGLIEVNGEKYSSNDEVINHLKSVALANCADGIIGIKTMYKDREKGYLLDDKNKEIYASKVMTGIAVRIKQDSVFSSKYMIKADTNSVGQNQLTQKGNDGHGSSFGSTLLAIILVAGIIAYVVIKNN